MPVTSIILTHAEGSASPHSQAKTTALRVAGVNLGPIEYLPTFLIEGELDSQASQLAAKVLADPVLEKAAVSVNLVPGSGSERTQLTVMRKAGVMDPAEASVMRTLQDAGIKASTIKCAHIYRFERALSDDQRQRASALLANQAIEDVHVGEFAIERLSMGGRYGFQRVEVPIRDLDENALRALSKERGLSMNIAELLAVQVFFREAGREPTDVELEMVAQTWSEHCKHKTLTGPVRYEEKRRDGEEIDDSLFELSGDVIPSNGMIRGLLQTTIKRATEELNKPWCWSVFVDNAGVIALDDEDGVCIKVETHNHPSAIEPYGGAGTGVGGVIRDILGTGLGAKPICNTDVFCFGPLDMAQDSVPKGALHPLVTMRGVVSGVRDYGNRMGIPTVNGALCFDERYTGNPLVYCGCVGVLPKKFVEKAARPGDKIVAVGGRTGRDGIGGATFSSIELTEESEHVSSGAVQIGNAIQEKVVLDAMLRARDAGLYTAVTDCGAGGFSSAVGEMGEITGAHVELTSAPLKYEGLSYREIWLSEAQERMVFAVPPENLETFLKVFTDEDVECAVLGTFSGDGRMKVSYQGNEVLDMPMSFLHDGLPKVERNAVWVAPATERAPHDLPPMAHGAALHGILASPNVCSKEWVVRQYDHEVQAMSAVKPFTGVGRDGPSDASALVPKPESGKAVVIGSGLNPHFGDIDPYWMAQSAIDEAVRNVVATGGDIDHCAILDNFSWGNCDKPQQLAAMVRACAGCYVASKGLGTPFISGKDSLNNEFATEAGTIAIPYTLLITALSVTPIAQLTTMDLKRAGNLLYQIGATWDETGRSHYELVSGQRGGRVPRLRVETALATYRALRDARAQGCVRSAHDCSEGGLAVALAEMAFAGGLGATVSLNAGLQAKGESLNDQALLFSESNSRLVIEVPADKAAAFESCFGKAGVSCTKLGEVTTAARLTIAGQSGETLIDEDIEALRASWKGTLYRAIGETVPA